MKTISPLLFLALLIASCSKDRLEADGNIVTEMRTPGTFTGVRSSGSTPVHITYGTLYKVELRGSGNLIPRFKSTITGSTLHLAYERVNVVHDDIEVYVTMPLLKNVDISGSGKIWVNGAFPAQQQLETRISGSGDIYVDDTFECDAVYADISGSGSANLQKINAKRSEAHISGSGSARLSVQNNLKVRISGSGKVYYSGSPVIDSEISGSGKVVKM
ncbi:GIN domain-containing protein [Hufsiella ginkgonis]|uniref:Putative auto-transporter adhesin head GIN domain-containing protein n=1 Tax=Hufsiella ginkgonis TaxID=2695274 RepID=A0A7K1Y0X7_9SPHI|nr:DUF2807 domain-containing protein [Hufsiella ginkgonis]MXV16326.1 hypothetical protein [Hufsiella ginkgonis]